jgi:hypothetical protein
MHIKNITDRLTTFRFLGITLIICAITGYFFVADEFRHVGEFLGVTCLLIAGIILLIKDFNLNIFRNFAIQWISIGLLASVPLGGILLDNMPLGITIGLLIGLLSAYYFGKKIVKKD